MPFVKGKSGNPAGRKKEVLAKRNAWKFGPKALDFIEKVMDDQEVPMKVRLVAATYLADRAYGKASQPVDMEANLNVTVNFTTPIKMA